MNDLYKKYGIQETAAYGFSTRYQVGDWFERCLYILDEKNIIKTEIIKDLESNALIFICLGILWYESEDLRDQDHIIDKDYGHLIGSFSTFEFFDKRRIYIFEKNDSEKDIIEKANEKRFIIYNSLSEYFTPENCDNSTAESLNITDSIVDLFFGNEEGIENIKNHSKFSQIIENNIDDGDISYCLIEALDKYYDDLYEIEKIRSDYDKLINSANLHFWIDQGFSI